MLTPTSNEEVSAVLKYCNQQKLAVVPQGGNTGLVGGSHPVFDEVILSLEKMNKIKGFDESYGIITAETGAILMDMQQHLATKGYAMPLDLGARGSCQIGGNLSTNAGGIHFIRHNSLHANCIGLKVVLHSGEILDNITTLRKDNTGYDLKHLFIGAEGTLGVITECAILCPPLPRSRQLALLGCNSFDDVV
jgi:FAD/FMN-containing dehydrogenase